MTGRDAECVQRMYRYADKLVAYVERHGLTPELLGRSEDHQWAVVTPLGVIGDAAARLRNHGVDLGPGIPLTEIAGLRNRLSHDYDGVNWDVVEEAVFLDVPRLRDSLAAIMAERGIDLPE